MEKLVDVLLKDLIDRKKCKKQLEGSVVTGAPTLAFQYHLLLVKFFEKKCVCMTLMPPLVRFAYFFLLRQFVGSERKNRNPLAMHTFMIVQNILQKCSDVTLCSTKLYNEIAGQAMIHKFMSKMTNCNYHQFL